MQMRDLVERSRDVFFCVRDVLLFWDVTKCVVNKSRKSDTCTYLVHWAKSFPHTKSGDPARTLTARNWNKTDKSTIGRLSRKYKHGGRC